MNRNTGEVQIKDASKRRAGNICWSSEWSFVEDADVVLQKTVRPLINKQLPAGKHADASPGSS